MKHKNKGFTVIEMVVTMLVLAIVLTLSIGGLLAWQDWANFNRQNEYAKMLFIAAQNQLSEYGVDGRLQELQDSLSGGSYDDRTGKHYAAVGFNLTDYISALKNADGAYDLGNLYPESGETDAHLYQGEIVSLRAHSGQYADYLADPEALKASDPDAYWVFELLGAYVYDTTILNGSKKDDGSGNGAAICVELTPDDGQVAAVLYSDRKDRFIYKGIAGDPDGSEETDAIADITDRTESYRRERMVGYYGVDTLYKATKGEILEPSLAMVRLYNKEDFYLACRLSAKDRVLLTSRLTYTMNLHGSDNEADKLLTITLKGTQLKNKESAEAIMCPVSRYDASGNAVALGNLPILAWVEPDYTIHVVLDGADIQATTSLYRAELSQLLSDEAGKTGETRFAKTLSYFRFGVKDDNLFASVSTTGGEALDSQTLYNFGNLNPFLNQLAKHATFAGEEIALQEGKTAYTYSIKNARHLYNVRYIEDLSYEQEAAAITADVNRSGVTFQVKSDIDWRAFQTGGNLYDSYQTSGNLLLSSLNDKLADEKGEKITTVNRYTCDFPSISNLRTRDRITGDSLLGDKAITGLAVSELSNMLYGTYIADAQDESGKIKQDKTCPVGFVNVNYGTIENLKLDGIRVSGERFVGGFCGINAGTIGKLETLNTDDTSVISGQEYVGGIMGFQMPTVEKIEISKLTNRATVQGVRAVGGITGMVRNEFTSLGDKLVLTELDGLSEDTKNLYQNVSAGGLTVKVTDCTNYGAVYGYSQNELLGVSKTETGTANMEAGEDQSEESRYIGGIVGYCYNVDEKHADRITIDNCTSAPLFTMDQLADITKELADEKNQKDTLKGVYVGGIVGYNYFGQIEGCSTKAERGKVSCLFGNRYVGGIVGFNIGPASGIVGNSGSEGIFGSSKPGENYNHVVAYAYAGGITGCNASASDKDSAGAVITGDVKMDPEKLQGILVPDKSRTLNVKVDNWLNHGVVIAVDEYSGGITGYNAGFIYRCNSDVEEDTADICFENLYSGSYCGGVTGYNNGIIGNTERAVSDDGKTSTVTSAGDVFETKCYVKGHCYVGGIVGYNDVDAIVEDYAVDSGYVLGDDGSCFVGGYAGLNVSIDLLMYQSRNQFIARDLHSNPSRVEGDYLVGGVIGGNIINTKDKTEDKKDISAINGVFMTDNFLGILEGKAFLGGFIGYNLLFKKDNPKENNIEKTGGAVDELQREIVDRFKTSDASIDASASDEQKREVLAEKKNILDGLTGSLSLKKSDVAMSISGEGDYNTSSYFGSITGKIFVGGVVGYNDANTTLTIKNVVNETAIEATEAIECKEEQIRYELIGFKNYRMTDYAGNDITYTYSYAGGIIGRVSANTLLDNCRNASAGTVRSAGTYTGGLCEVNEGTVQNCQVSSFGSSTDDYVGGLCGLNKSTIKKCRFTYATVSGRNMVGGIAAENFGIISDITLDHATLLAEGIQDEAHERDGVAGLYAAFNGYCANNSYSGKILLTEDISNASVRSGGRYVGLVVGVNEGRIKNKKADAGQLVLHGTVRGYQSVGGLIGMNTDSGLFKYFPDLIDVVQYYTNEASVTATNGNAGGIIGENRNKNIIRNCVNNGVVTATDEGNAGGITSSNNGWILNCRDQQVVSAPGGKSGGITAVNERDGVIRSCFVASQQEDQQLIFQSAEVAGAIAAQNSGIIGSNRIKNVTISNQTDVENAVIGVVVGENLTDGRIYLRDNSLLSALEGIFSDKDLVSDGMALENCKVIVQSNYSKAGGIAGTNAGTIRGAIESNLIQPQLSMQNATIADLGGVAGVNSGTIRDIAVDAVIQGELGSEATGYGGIAGRSGSLDGKDRVATGGNTVSEAYSAVISNCSFDGVINAEGSSGAPVRVGGIVGINGYGSLVTDCTIGARTEGRTGQTEEEAKITYVTAGDYLNKTSESVSTTDTKSYSYLGGIVGDNYGSVLACDNEKKSADTVQIIGFAGETGGIAGYNEKYGVVSGYLDVDGKTEHYLTTGKTWSVDQRSCGNDRGPGGIIGKSVSAEDMSYVKNYAPVTCDYKANTYVAGLIGVLGQQEEIKTRFYKCENYGDISSYRSAGGLVGMLESNGADFVSCNNWGNIYGASRCSGGLVALHYSFAAGLEFRHCANHGNVTGAGTNVGGFLAGEENVVPENYGIDGKVVNYLYDCVNTGIIRKDSATQPASNTGVFFGLKNGSSRLIMELCRNYNTSNSANGFVGNGGDLRFKNCLDDSGVTTTNGFTPFGGGSGWNTNMFYLDQSSETTFSHKNYGVYFSFHEGPIGDFSYNGLNYRNQLRDPSYLFAEPDKSNKLIVYGTNNRYNYRQLNISLNYDNGSQGLDSMVVYFWNGSDVANSGSVNHTHSVTATYLYRDGQIATCSAIADGYYDVVPEAKVVLKNPSDDKKPVSVRLKFDDTSSDVKLRGISYIPAEESGSKTEAVCTYLGEKYDTEFCISEICKLTNTGERVIETYYSDSYPFKQSLPPDTWYGYPDDVMDIDWAPYSNFRLEYAAGESADITFEVENGKNATGMDSFVFYLANANTNAQTEAKSIDTRYYDYSVSFTDINGNTVRTNTVKDAVGYDSGESDYMSKSRQEVKVPQELASPIAKICLHIKATKRVYEKNNNATYTNEGKIYFRGFGWIPKGKTAEQKMAAGTNPTASATFADRQEDGSTKHTHLKVTARDEKSYVYLPYDYNTGFYMENNPVSDTYYGDDLAYTSSLTDGKNSGGRIDTYLELDPNFMELTEDVCTVEKKLATPSDLKVSDTNSSFYFSWGRSPDAYAYEVFYELKDHKGTTVFTSDHEIIGSLQLNDLVSIDDSWRENDYRLTFHVRALNAYHFDHDDSQAADYNKDYGKYDSDWTSLELAVTKKPLPKPEVHMEVVAGNRITFVLDNYQEYVEQNCTDCTMKVYFNGKSFDWNVAEDGKYRKPEYVTGSPSSPTDFRYYAAPNGSLKDAYTNSEVHYQKGEGHANEKLPDSAVYCKTRFLGFYGTEADDMEYRIQFEINSLDTYIMTDISAYDAQIGATVGYDSEITHVANSYSGGGSLKLTSALKNLPESWFASDCMDKITARAYPYHSQFDLIHYGHEVAEGLTLDGTPEENRQKLSEIYDKVYFAENAEKPAENCIWDADKKDLKSGYLLQKQDDGTYDVYYSAIIEMSQQAAQAQHEIDGNDYREYYRYDIAYRSYQNMSAETKGKIVVNSGDYQESYWSRGITNANGDTRENENYYTVETTKNERWGIQEIQSAPIVSSPVVTKDEQERTVYSFNWDTYYQDTACWDVNNRRYSSNNDKQLTNPPKDLYPTWDAYMDKAEHAGLTGELSNDEWRKLMNAYYSSYSEATYRVDLIGTTQDGEEVILQSKTVEDPTQLPDVEKEAGMTTKGGQSTSYHVWDYECSFTDTNHTWNNYPKLTARVMRLGSLSSVRSFNYNGGNARKDDNSATYMLPRYTDTTLSQKLRLNTISKPNVSLLKENGQFITDDLIYEVKWGAITNKKQLQDLGGYLITASVKEAADQANTAKTHYYYVSDPGREGDTINLDIQALEAEGVVVCVQDDYEKSSDICKTRINLSDFNTGDVVQISVKAIAGKQAENYTDGEEGVTTEIKIPTRLVVPDTQKLKLSGELCTTGTIPLTDYRQGLALQYTADDSYVKVANARMKLSAAVFDVKPDGAESDRQLTNATDWEQGAYRILYQKKKPLDLGKISEEGTSILDVTEFERYPGEFAGKWLKLVLKASSATKIDSQWTDQDPDEKTLNYVWVQLPKLKLADVDLKELSQTEEGDVIRYAYAGDLTNEPQYENRDTQIASKSLRFSEDKNVNGYQITLTGKAEALSENSSEENAQTKHEPVYQLYLQRHLTDRAIFDGTWDVYLATGAALTQSSETSITEPTGAALTLSEENAQAVCIQNPDAIWIGMVGEAFAELSDGNAQAVTLLDIPQLQMELLLDAGKPGSNTYAITAQLRYVAGGTDGNGNGTFTIVLPDVTMIGDAPYAEDYFIESVLVQQYVEETASYEAGRGALYTKGKKIELTNMQKGGDGPDENKTENKARTKNAADGQFRSSDGHGSDRRSSRADILSVSPFTVIQSFFTDIQTDRSSAVQAACAGLVRCFEAGTVQFLLRPVGIFI